MTGIAREALDGAVSCFFNYDPGLEERVRKEEDAIDLLQKEITQYLVEISSRTLEQSEAEEIPVLVHSINDVERIGDHAENIIELAVRKSEQKLELTEAAVSELKEIAALTAEMIDAAVSALQTDDRSAARRILAAEEKLNSLQIQLKESHVIRLQNQECHILAGLVFVSFVDNLEKIGDHITNIAQASLRHLRWNREPDPEKEDTAV